MSVENDYWPFCAILVMPNGQIVDRFDVANVRHGGEHIMRYEATYHVMLSDGRYIGDANAIRLVQHVRNAFIFSRDGALRAAMVWHGRAMMLRADGSTCRVFAPLTPDQRDGGARFETAQNTGIDY